MTGISGSGVLVIHKVYLFFYFEVRRICLVLKNIKNTFLKNAQNMCGYLKGIVSFFFMWFVFIKIVQKV